jgi:ATP-dependent DNA ligase
MALPFGPPIEPMLAKLVSELPLADGLLYEPKWDGFRSIVFCDGAEIELSSRSSRPLTRYFPEVVTAIAASVGGRCVLDGEIVIAGANGLDFDALLQRIHPAQSRVDRLAAETPASFVAFDLLAEGDEDLRPLGFAERRRRLEARLPRDAPSVHVTPQSTDPTVAADWFSRFEGAGLDGVMAKSPDLPYRAGDRVMWKVKHERTADCVVGGFRWHKQEGVGSLLLGLYDDTGGLHHVGVCSGFSAARRRELLDELAPVRLEDPGDHPWRHAGQSDDAPGPSASRWNPRKGLDFEPLAPTLVCEVAFDHMQSRRFRHATNFRRWRPDRTAVSCTYGQLDVVVPAELAELFGR